MSCKFKYLHYPCLVLSVSVTMDGELFKRQGVLFDWRSFTSYRSDGFGIVVRSIYLPKFKVSSSYFCCMVFYHVFMGTFGDEGLLLCVQRVLAPPQNL